MMSLCEFQDSGEFQSNTIAPLFFEVLSLVDRFLFAEVASQLKNGRNTLRGKRHGIVKTIRLFLAFDGNFAQS